MSLVQNLPSTGVSGQDESSGTTTSIRGRFSSAQESWDVIVQVPTFNPPNLTLVSGASRTESDFDELISEAADLPGDIEAPDTPEMETERSDVTEALNEVQLGLIAEQGE